MFNLTKQERLILIFIASAILIGSGVRFGLKRFAKLRPIYNLDNLAGENLKANAKIDLNLAGAEDLTGIPGIGQILAERILQYRNANGPFKCLEDLRNVKGIGEKNLKRFKDYFYIGGQDNKAAQ